MFSKHRKALATLSEKRKHISPQNRQNSFSGSDNANGDTMGFHCQHYTNNADMELNRLSRRSDDYTVRIHLQSGWKQYEYVRKQLYCSCIPKTLMVPIIVVRRSVLIRMQPYPCQSLKVILQHQLTKIDLLAAHLPEVVTRAIVVAAAAAAAAAAAMATVPVVAVAAAATAAAAAASAPRAPMPMFPQLVPVLMPAQCQQDYLAVPSLAALVAAS